MKANHAVGAELTYECLGGNQYRLTYAFYRDCVSIAAPTSVNINYSSSCFTSSTVNLIPVAGTPTQIVSVCPSVQTTCNGGAYTGVEEWIYSGVVTLAGTCVDWTFSTAVCCRNAAITTVNNVTNYQLYVFALLNNSDGNCNNSPDFINRPILKACLNQQVCFSNAVSDIDGDSVSYQMITPLSAAGSAIQYLFPFSSTQPVLSSPPVNFNPNTGELCMVATQVDISPYGLLVSEFRNGVLIGQVERDIQIEVQSCNNQNPFITGFDGGPIKSRNVCPGVPTSFFLLSFDTDSIDQTTISWNSGIPAAQFSSWGGHRDSATFSWTPTLTDVATNPHCFSVTVMDDHCPYTNSIIANYCLTVLDSSSATCQINTIEEKNLAPTISMFRVENRVKLSWKENRAFSIFTIYDAAGRTLFESKVAGKTDVELTIENYPSGAYIISLDGAAHWRKSVLKE